MIVIVNRSTVLTHEEIHNVMPAFRAFAADLVSVWGPEYHHEIEFKLPADVVAGDWVLEVLDHTDTPGAGGYHTDDNGRVSGKVFAADAIEAGESWTVDATHELGEMSVNPTAGNDLSQYVVLQDRYGLDCLPEICDAVEGDQWAYEHPSADGKLVKVSAMVTPAYFFRPNIGGMKPDQYAFPASVPLDKPAPALLQDGYLGLYDPSTGRYSQVSDFAMLSRRHVRSARRVASQVKR